MASYSVELATSAKRDLLGIGDKKTRQKIGERIDELADDPRAHGCEKLAGPGSRYRARQGDYRILYEIHDEVKIVSVRKIGHRREVYR